MKSQNKQLGEWGGGIRKVMINMLLYLHIKYIVTLMILIEYYIHMILLHVIELTHVIHRTHTHSQYIHAITQ